MKKLIITTFVVAALSLVGHAQCCNKKAQEKEASAISCCDKKENTEIKAYYFHSTRRCATCQAVETVTQEALQECKPPIAFTSINRDEENNAQLVEKFKASGQKLILVKGDKIIDLTNDAFMNARTHPDKLKAKIKSTIESLM